MGEDATGGDRRDRQRLTVPEAATVLEVTVDAVRGRIRRGKLASEHDSNGTVYVWANTPKTDRPGPSLPVEGPSTDQSELIEELRDRVRALEEANRENRRIIAALTQRIPEIEAPRDSTPETRDAPETGTESEPGTETRGPAASDAGQSRRSWVLACFSWVLASIGFAPPMNTHNTKSCSGMR